MSGPALLGPLLSLAVLAAGAQPAAPSRAAAPARSPDLATLLPAPAGWTPKEAPRRYTPDDLFEYIDGAADGFVDADVVEVVSRQYEAPGGQSLTVDVYRHADPDAAFGIYSQERPGAGPLLVVGTQGYHEKGALNFWKGDCYVKLAAFGLGDGERAVLLEIAASISRKIPGEARMPALLDALPPDGRVAGSERYLRKNVLGYPFLARAFTARYEAGGKTLSLFVLAPGDEAGARAMLAAYATSQGTTDAPRAGTPVTFQDRHHGVVTMVWSGPFVVAVAGDGATGAAPLLEAARRRLKAP